MMLSEEKHSLLADHCLATEAVDPRPNVLVVCCINPVPFERYTAEVMDSLNFVARGVTAKPEAINLPKAYLKNAGRVAQIRATEASRRLVETCRMAIK